MPFGKLLSWGRSDKEKAAATAVAQPSLLPAIDQDRQDRLRLELQRRQAADFYYLVDVVGTCNLRCPSCPVGNYEAPAAKGLMDFAYFEKLVLKAEAEVPNKRLFFDLYNWGEPALHPELPRFIAFLRRRGWGVGLSCNLNVFPTMREVVKERPSYIRVSLSGYSNDVYQQTHRKGDVNRVKANMHLLRHYMDIYKSDVVVQVGYHVYRTNFPDDFLSMRRLCDELGFLFAPTIATLMPVEKAAKAVDGEIAPADRAVADRFVLSIAEWAEAYAPLRGQQTDCQYRSHRTTINFDGSVPLCCATFEPGQIVARDFLEVGHEELQRRKYDHPFCGTCMSRNLDMMYTAVMPQTIERRAADVLGPAWESFLENWRKPVVPRIAWEGRRLEVQEACDLAASYVRADDIESAGRLYRLVAEECPDHAEAVCQIGWIAARLGDVPAALEHFDRAAELYPGHEPYRAAPGLLLRSLQADGVDRVIATAEAERDLASAKRTLEAVVAAFPDHRRARDALENLGRPPQRPGG
jgi:MoaA/NifB/PqqE/SkfB family radical SAM enzyme